MSFWSEKQVVVTGGVGFLYCLHKLLEKSACFCFKILLPNILQENLHVIGESSISCPLLRTMRQNLLGVLL